MKQFCHRLTALSFRSCLFQDTQIWILYVWQWLFAYTSNTRNPVVVPLKSTTTCITFYVNRKTYIQTYIRVHKLTPFSFLYTSFRKAIMCQKKLYSIRFSLYFNLTYLHNISPVNYKMLAKVYVIVSHIACVMLKCYVIRSELIANNRPQIVTSLLLLCLN